jgi:hypothetical protein
MVPYLAAGAALLSAWPTYLGAWWVGAVTALGVALRRGAIIAEGLGSALNRSGLYHIHPVFACRKKTIEMII